MSEKSGSSAKGEMGGTGEKCLMRHRRKLRYSIFRLSCVLRFSCSSHFFRSSRILDASRAFLAFPAYRARGCP